MNDRLETINCNSDSTLKYAIKAALLKGGLVCTVRGAGKTTALREILLENNGAIAVTNTRAHRDILIYGFQELKDRVYTLHEFDRIYKYSNFTNKVYIEEYDPQLTYPPFFAAVTSKVTVIT
jgi:hypothetical protein